MKSWQQLLNILCLCFLTQQASGGFRLLTLVSFNGTNGSGPCADLIEASDGGLYGTTSGGGRYRNGTVFRLTLRGKFTMFASLDGVDGAGPLGALVQADDGSFLGTARGGGQFGVGGIFKVLGSGSVTNVYSFSDGGDIDGNFAGYPAAGLLRGADGNYYGTTQAGGDPYEIGSGTIFRLDTNGLVTFLHTFDRGIDGGYPSGQLLRGLDGNLYGSTAIGGAGDGGTIFRLTLDGTFSNLVSFNTPSADGWWPEGRLIQDAEGNLYGTTSDTAEGFIINSGTVFKLATNGTFTTLLYFSDHPVEGRFPEAGLIQAKNGLFYGTTSGGGYGYGAVFQMGPNGALTTVCKFNGKNGGYPVASLLEASDGNLYGTTSTGGRFGKGTVFCLKRTRPLIVTSLPHPAFWTRTPEFTLRGKTKALAPVSAVFYRVNGSEWAEATTTDGWTNWVAYIVSKRGLNSVNTYAVDATGDTSHTNTLRYFTAATGPHGGRSIDSGTGR